MALNNNNVLKISTLILVVLLFFSLFNFYKITSNFDSFKEKSAEDFKLKQSQLDEILSSYDSLRFFNKDNESVVLNKGKKNEFEDLESQRANIENSDEVAIDSQIQILKTIIKANLNKVGVLNNKINSDNKILKKLESLKQKDVKLNADKLSVININARGVKIITDKYARISDKKIQQLRVCFTVEGSEFIKKGDKKFYIQVVNPRNQIISTENTFIELNDVKLTYSTKIEASYNQKDTDICTYVDLEKNKTIKGKYKINVYNEFSKIGTAIFEYN